MSSAAVLERDRDSKRVMIISLTPTVTKESKNKKKTMMMKQTPKSTILRLTRVSFRMRPFLNSAAVLVDKASSP